MLMDNYVATLHSIMYRLDRNDFTFTINFCVNLVNVYSIELSTSEFTNEEYDSDTLSHNEIKIIISSFVQSINTMTYGTIEIYDSIGKLNIIHENGLIKFQDCADIYQNTFTVVVNDSLKQVFTTIYEMY